MGTKTKKGCYDSSSMWPPDASPWVGHPSSPEFLTIIMVGVNMRNGLGWYWVKVKVIYTAELKTI
jgi:hypothetical protein